MDNTIIMFVVLGFLFTLFGVGIWASREARSVAGYYVAGKKLPSWVIAFSSNATGESAWLLLGLTGMGYAVGIHALWVVVGEAVGVLAAWLWVARPFKAFTDRYEAVTVADFLEGRFRDSRHLLRLMSVFVVLTMVFAYAAAQFTATGKAFNSFFGMNYMTGVVLGGIFAVAYTAVGGFKADAYNDVLQGTLMLLGLIALPIVGIATAGGWGAMLESVRAQDPLLLHPMGNYGITVPGVVSVLGFLAIGIAWLAVPQILARFMSASSQREIVYATPLAVIVVILFDVGAVFGGIAGRAIFPGLADPEAILPTMASELFPPIVTGVFLVIVLAAIMSTIDSLLLLLSSSVVRDLVQKTLNVSASDRTLAMCGRAATVIIGTGALLLALGEVRAVFWFVLFAWSGLAGAFVPPVLCGLFWKRTTLPGALSGMVTGFLVTIAWVLFFKAAFHDLYEMIPGVLAGVVATVLVSLRTRPPEDAVAEFESIRGSIRPPFSRAGSDTSPPVHLPTPGEAVPIGD